MKEIWNTFCFRNFH